MRKPFEPQLQLGGCAIASVALNLGCRDELIPILAALQHIYGQETLRREILALVAADVNGRSSARRGRGGMTYWQILVLASVRLGCNLDYDKLQDLAEQHRTLRAMMGLGPWEDHMRFDWRRIRDNVCKLRPETVTAISHLIVSEGERFVPDAPTRVRGDSFVCRTPVHYPTDSSLIGDGVRKVLELAPRLAKRLGLAGWRQHKYLGRKLRRALRAVNKAYASRGRGCAERRCKAFEALFALTDQVLARAREVYERARARWADVVAVALADELGNFLRITERVRGYAYRRVILGERIENHEKVFSVFETHTELIRRNTKRVPITFGHSVLVFENAAGFITHHKVLAPGENDVTVLVPEMAALQERTGGRITHASFDCGFHSPANQVALAELVAHPCLRAKGARQGARQARDAGVEFRRGRRRHPGIESAIGALQAGNGQCRCRDRTLVGFERYVALGVLGRNLHVLGKLVIARVDAKARAAYTRRKPAAA